MPELRKDPVLGRWVIISTERAKRPKDFKSTPEKKKITPKECPFCTGNEVATPPEIFSIRPDSSKPNTPGWTLRVIPNKFPALRIEGEIDRRGEGIYDRMNGIGAHEVIIETPEHAQDLADMEPNSFTNVVRAYQQRILDLRKDERLRYVMIFKNFGAAAGASLEHSHSQLIATPVVPKRVMEEMDGAKRYFEYRERCIFCDIVVQETKTRKRLISENNSFLLICPFAPRFPFECWILPRNHSSNFEDASAEELKDLASILKDCLMRLEKALNTPPYNYIIHTAPITVRGIEFYHYHLEIIPVLTHIAGFEWGTGFYINPTGPEDSAAFLKNIL
ncbi:galactose-1-phosphate uridylyltransferase [candidate division WOR_3 bacterium SM23_42]|uniref:Galactose-1-phosphate uridylyltransferase n=1 Tax=candidate division WOR_3 bacterium SM23_42 TaxID=1703779 RepID=A0A0S8FVY3_UNCW3|nr:MAG: galactose-1-phosphate uridylyltransferase [candidate division WOR_3 bacterium SM23_42]